MICNFYIYTVNLIVYKVIEIIEDNYLTIQDY